MKGTPKSNEEKIRNAIHVWDTLCPDKSFGSMSNTQFKNAVKASLDLRDEITELETQLVAKQDQRDAADETSLQAIKRFVAGIKADPDEGENSELLQALGYVRPSDRQSGLHRATAKSGEAPPAHS